MLSTSEETELVDALEAALRVAAKARSPDHALFFQMLCLRDRPESAPKELFGLLEKLKRIPALKIFDHAHQCALGYRVPVDHLFLARWLISRSQCTASGQAVTDLSHYLSAETLELTETLAIDGIELEAAIDVGGHRLTRWADVPMTDTKWRIATAEATGRSGPSAALTRRHRVHRTHVRPWDADPEALPPSVEVSLDVLRCLTAVSGGGHRLLNHWLEPDPWAPWAVNMSTFGVDDTSVLLPVNFDSGKSDELCECVSRFVALAEADSKRLRIPLDRLNRSIIAGPSGVERAIELGISIESLYAPSKLAEGIGYAIKTRAAKFLGGSINERHQIAAVLRDLYDLRSLAVHAGRFDAEGSKKRWRDPREVRAALDAGQQTVQRSLLKLIRDGEPRWEDLDLS